MQWIYLSPHFDDVALSCAGLVWEQAQLGEQVEVWTVCGGDPPQAGLSPFARQLHARWETGSQATDQRRQEDINSCAAMHAGYRHFDLPDCIYRQAPASGEHLYASESAIFGPLDPAEAQRVKQLGSELAAALPPQAEVVCPLTLGGHVDPRLTRAAASLLDRRLWYYADYPYVLKAGEVLAAMEQAGWRRQVWPISEAGLSAWQASVAAHASQISTFWPSQEEMRAALRKYRDGWGGAMLQRLHIN
jgi:LmbE family N-acetylglucosaminyl deacetylase